MLFQLSRLRHYIADLFAELPKRAYLTLKYHGWRSVLFRIVTFPLRLTPLGPRLGPLLFQCPPRFKHEPGRLGTFLDALPADIRYAFEFRDPTWVVERPALAERGAAWCIGETDDAPLDPQTLEEWLKGEGWPEERRGELACEYETGRALLARSDEELNH